MSLKPRLSRPITTSAFPRATLFVNALPLGQTPSPALEPLEHALAAALDAARARWPDVSLPEGPFLSFLAGRAFADPTLEDWLAHTHVTDLYLAFAANQGD